MLEHVSQVADLSWRFMHGQEGSAPATLEDYLQQLFLLSPWCDDGAPSLVYEDDRGRVVGFLGVIVRRMKLGVRALRAAFGSGFIVHPDSRTTSAGLQLVQAFFSGNQDLSLSDTANPTSQTIWTGFGGSIAPSYAMHWGRPLRLALYAFYALSRRSKMTWTNDLASLSKPLCKATDAFIARVPLSPFRRPNVEALEEDLDVETLLSCLADSHASYAVRPAYDRDSLSWLLKFMSYTKAYGTLRKVLLRSKEGKTIGCYVYYMNSEGIAELVLLCASGQSAGTVIDHLFYDAWAHGAIGIHGKLETRFAQELSKKCCFSYDGKDPLLVHSREPELVQLFHKGDAFFTRLDGEWCLRFGTPVPARRQEGKAYLSKETEVGAPIRPVGHGLRTEIPESTSQAMQAFHSKPRLLDD